MIVETGCDPCGSCAGLVRVVIDGRTVGLVEAWEHVCIHTVHPNLGGCSMPGVRNARGRLAFVGVHDASTWQRNSRSTIREAGEMMMHCGDICLVEFVSTQQLDDVVLLRLSGNGI